MYNIISNFLAFLFDNFSLLDPDLQIECGSRSRRKMKADTFGSGSTALVINLKIYVIVCHKIKKITIVLLKP